MHFESSHLVIYFKFVLFFFFFLFFGGRVRATVRSVLLMPTPPPVISPSPPGRLVRLYIQADMPIGYSPVRRVVD